MGIEKRTIILNPIKGNHDIIQIFYYETMKNLIGIQIKDNIKWYRIDCKERLICYKDSYGKEKFVYYNFVLKEKEIIINKD